MLYIVATPIGNLGDITLRALEVLKSVDGIICEDSRRTSLLLNHYQIFSRHSREGGNPKSVSSQASLIKIPIIVLNDYNEYKILPSIIEKLKSGENLALVSDAGTPLISDPGYKLVRECIHQGIPVDSLPGPSSVITALTLSGLPPDKFLFLGYLPEKAGHRKQLLEGVKLFHLEGGLRWHLSFTIAIFVSPHKLLRTLEDMKGVFGDIEVVLAKELTKIHQSVEKKTISKWLEDLTNPSAGGPKGEYVLLFNLN